MPKSFDVNTLSVQMTITPTRVKTVLDVDAEQLRCENEAGRVAAEEQRVASETVREQAETARKAAENARSEAEQERIANEEIRKANFESISQVIQQTTGNSTTAVMSQKATTQAIKNSASETLEVAMSLIGHAEADNRDIFANALKGNKSGEVIAMTDVSPTEHNLKVKVSSDTVIDLSAATLSAYGKNLFNNDTSLLTTITYISSNGTQNTRIGYEPLALPAGTYTFTLKDLDTSLIKYIYGFIGDKDGKAFRGCSLLAGTTNQTPRTITIAEGEYVYIYNGNSALNMDVRAEEFAAVEIQLEVGEKGTEYEPYKAPINYPIYTTGEVPDVKSLYPSTTLMTDTPGVTIECEYNRDITKVLATIEQAILSMGGNI